MNNVLKFPANRNDPNRLRRIFRKTLGTTGALYYNPDRVVEANVTIVDDAFMSPSNVLTAVKIIQICRFDP